MLQNLLLWSGKLADSGTEYKAFLTGAKDWYQKKPVPDCMTLAPENRRQVFLHQIMVADSWVYVLGFRWRVVLIYSLN